MDWLGTAKPGHRIYQFSSDVIVERIGWPPRHLRDAVLTLPKECVPKADSRQHLSLISQEVQGNANLQRIGTNRYRASAVVPAAYKMQLTCCGHSELLDVQIKGGKARIVDTAVPVAFSTFRRPDDDTASRLAARFDSKGE